MPKLRLYLFLFLLTYTVPSLGQQTNKKLENALLWEISGNGLKQPSYLFGTFHLLGKEFLRQLPQVEEKLGKTQAVVGEMIIDSTALMSTMTAMIMTNNTLDKLLSPEDYKLTGAYLKEVSGYDIAMFNMMKPMTLQVLLSTMDWAKNNTSTTGDIPMDSHFQQQAKTNGRKVFGLETLDDQLQALYGQFSLERQAEMLIRFVREKDKNRSEMQKMTSCYQKQDLSCLQSLLFSTENYRPEEMTQLIDARNLKWMEQIPTLMDMQPVFVAVGAGHLVGNNGLINLLRAKGYTVTPLSSK